MSSSQTGSRRGSAVLAGVKDSHIVEQLERAIDEKNVDTLEAIDHHVNRRLTRKFDLHIMPILFGIWLFAFIDRSNIGNARIDGLTTELKLTGNQFNLALLVFYIPYILVDVPSNWIVKKVGSGIYLPTLITCWGLTSTFLGFAKNLKGLIVARVFLGLFEGGLLGGIIVYLAMFYRRHEMLYRIGLFYCAAPLSGAFGGLLATGLARIKVHDYKGWPWIFFIEGAMTVVFGLIAIYFLPDTPGHAKFLTDDEKAIAMARLRADALGATLEDDIEKEKFDWHWVKMAFLNPNLWFTSLAWFLILIPLYSFSLFLPTIIKALGYTAVKAQLYTVPPNVCAFVLVLVTAIFSDKVKARGPFMIAGCLLAIAGYLMQLLAKKPGTKYGGTFLVAMGVFPCSPMVMGWLSNNTAPHYVRATSVGFQIAFANCAAFVATYAYLAKDAPKYTLGHSICVGALGLCIIVVSAGIVYCKWENSQRDKGHRDHRLTETDESRLGHRHPRFRYTI